MRRWSTIPAARAFVIGELACGSLPEPRRILDRLTDLPQAPITTHAETLDFVTHFRLGGRGIGWIDVHLLASARLAGRASSHTRDQRLPAAPDELGLSL